MGLEKIKKIVFNTLKFVSVLLVLFILYVCFVPPFGEIPRAERLKIKKVDPSENALTSYNLAIKDLEDVTIKPTLAINSKMEKAALGAIVDDELRAFLEEHKAAVEHLKEAAKCSQYQFYDYNPTFSDPYPDYLASRQLFNLSGLQARDFIDKGELVKAAEINLAAYKMAVNFSTEPNGNLIFNLISVSDRAIVAANLFYLLTQKNIPTDTLIEIARQIEKFDDQIPSPYLVMMREWKTTQFSLDVLLVEQKENYGKQKESYGKLNYLPSALKLRLYQDYMKKLQRHMMLMSTPLRQWDFENLKVAQDLSNELSNSLLDIEWIDLTNVSDMFTYSSSPTMASLYIGRAHSAALRVFALCAAYEKIHGKFPDTLEQAFDKIGAKAGLSIPIDPFTSQPIGYRLQDGKPVVWFIGKDCQDDGGKKSYTLQEIHKGDKGVDIVFFYGELPLWLKVKTN